MKAYGVPRLIDLECPDKADIKYFGLSTTDRCSRKDRGKNTSRRIWKKKYRAKQRHDTRSALFAVAEDRDFSCLKPDDIEQFRALKDPLQ